MSPLPRDDSRDACACGRLFAAHGHMRKPGVEERAGWGRGRGGGAAGKRGATFGVEAYTTKRGRKHLSGIKMKALCFHQASNPSTVE